MAMPDNPNGGIAPPGAPGRIKSDGISTKGWKTKGITDPKNWNGCEQCAKDIQSNIGGDIVRIVPADGAPSLGGYRGTNPAWAYHEVVVKNGRVYDAFGPRGGVPVGYYKSLFQYPDAIDFGF